jgi:tRNA pseudouridine32 synthase/23S rRNA pseudouridine746 synthase/23S rRNA pseudouridine1911/1915/1917 synthase
MKVLEALKQIYPQSSRRTLQQWLKGGRFTVDGQLLYKDSDTLETGQVLLSEEAFRPRSEGLLNVLYEDKSLIIIDKPNGLLSVPLDVPSAKPNALELLRNLLRSDQVFPVHRLDKDSSGSLMFAKGRDSMEHLKDMFEKHDLEREYFAIVEGRLSEKKGTWECTLKESPNFDVVVSHDPTDGKRAITHFEVVRYSPKYTFLRLLLETGRKHQIRVHCQRAGYPILGDKRYGCTENPLKRLALHAQKLAFTHPFTGKPLSFISPIPACFKKLGVN